MPGFITTQQFKKHTMSKQKTGKGLAALLDDAPDKNEPSLKFIKIADITPNPLNPRKTFDQASMDELVASVLKVGVIQPITVRERGGKYELVCGERRYQAALSVNAAFKDRNTIPASIRQLTDQQAMELMVTENLQRKDVHPMEEADAFKFMMDNMFYTVPDIAAKIGKPEPFVNRRLQLLNLTEDLVKIFRTEELPVGHAELLSRLEPVDQQMWHDKKYAGPQYNAGAGTLKELKSWLKDYTATELSKAPFDIAEEGIGTIRSIACTNCPNNTAVMNLLFPDSPENAICTFKACYRDKCEQNLVRQLEIALSDPEMVLVYDSYSSNGMYEKLKADGYQVLKGWNEFTPVSEPDLQDWLDSVDRDDFDTEEEYQVELTEANANYADEVKEFQERSDKRKRAFDTYSGKYLWVEIKESNRSTQTGSSPTNGRADLVANVDQKKKRGLELDQEKIMKRIVDRIKELQYTKEPTSADLSTVEMDCLVALAFDKSGSGDIVKEGLGLGKNFYSYNEGPRVVEAVKNASPELRALIIRRALYYQHTSITPNSMSGGVIFHLAKDWCPDELKTFTDEQNAIKVRREARLDQKIKEFDGKNTETPGGGVTNDKNSPKKGKKKEVLSTQET